MNGDELTLERVKRLHTLALESWCMHVRKCENCKSDRDCRVIEQIDATIDKWEYKIERLEREAENARAVKRIMGKLEREGLFGCWDDEG